MIEAERAKYSRAFRKIREYSDISPGKMLWHIFLEEIDPKPGETIIDLGCGRGLVAKEMADAQLQVTQLDLDDYREEGPFQERYDFIKASLWEPIYGTWKYGYCCDVMEHLPTEYVMLALKNIMAHIQTGFFLISTIEDIHGKQIGETMHLTIRDFNWWMRRLNEVGTVVHARDIIASGLYVVNR